MANPYFRFKRFTVFHDRCAMKVGTDGVLLGAWADVSGADRILDIGTGTGLIALMLAQRSGARITALEINEDAVLQATENVNASPWKERIEVLHRDFNHFATATKFHLIVSNPPYFNDSLLCPEAQRSAARHTHALSYKDLWKGTAALLHPQGRFCVIIPTDVVENILTIAADVSLYLSQRLDVITSPGKQAKRTLLEFLPYPPEVVESKEMLIEEKRHQYSPEYIALTRDYYLHM